MVGCSVDAEVCRRCSTSCLWSDAGLSVVTCLWAAVTLGPWRGQEFAPAWGLGVSRRGRCQRDAKRVARIPRGPVGGVSLNQICGLKMLL